MIVGHTVRRIIGHHLPVGEAQREVGVRRPCLVGLHAHQSRNVKAVSVGVFAACLPLPVHQLDGLVEHRRIESISRIGLDLLQRGRGREIEGPLFVGKG